MASPWFTVNDFNDGVASADYATSIANIVDDLQDFVTTNSDGKASFDVAGMLEVAQQRNLELPLTTGALLFPNLLFTTNVRPILDRLKADLELTDSVPEQLVGPPLDIQPLLDDCEAKSQAVTEYFDKLYDVIVPDLVDAALESGSLDKNVPAVDDLTKKTVYWRYTWSNDWGHESQPSPVSVAIELGTKDSVNVARGVVPSGYSIDHWRVYRSSSGSQAAAWLYVPNDSDDLGFPTATANFDDEVPDSDLREELPSITWDQPDDELADIQPMANGIHVGVLAGRTLCPSENFKPWTFPIDYRKAIHDEVVKVLGWQDALFVATRGRPHFLLGNDAASMTLQPIDGEACVSARSVCLTNIGPVYASPDGLCLAIPGQPAKNLTSELFTREEWQALGPENLIVASHDGIAYLMLDDAAVADTVSTSVPMLRWYDASDAATLETDGSGDVTLWMDKSGNEAHAYQYTIWPGPARGTPDVATNRWAAGAVRFIGNDVLKMPPITLDEGNGCTVLMVVYFSSIYTTWTSIALVGKVGGVGSDQIDSGAPFIGAYTTNSSPDTYGAGQIQLSGGGLAMYSPDGELATGKHLIEFRIPPGDIPSAELYIDGVLQSTTVVGSPAGGALTLDMIGGQNLYVGNSNQLAEARFYDGSVTNDELAAERAALQAKWGL